MTTGSVDPRSITDAERPFLDALDTLGQIADLRRRIIAAGESPAVANGVVGWLVAKKVGDPDTSSAQARTNYRKVLRQLAANDRPKGRRRSVEAGYAELAPVVGIAAGAIAGAVALAVSGPAAASIGAPVALYVTRSPAELLDEAA